ncbi:arginine kinase isoform X1 [Onthophagus taurus]|uniref:arginine kinase isoform X1 n=2 Tax=Onthophagus taurus TaxID=166361 RepID=UPI000C20EE0E|nr:arginine kinase isoform X1 [Onthophagus taurus]
MFTLWYSVLSWKEYRETIQKTLFQTTPPHSAPQKQEPPKPTIRPTTPQNIPSKIPQPQNISPQPQSISPKPQSISPQPGNVSPRPQSISPQPPDSPRLPPSSPKQSPKIPTPVQSTRIPSPQPPSRLQPVKPPRSPSPHPILNEQLDDIDFNDEDSEEDEDSVINGNDWPEDLRNPSQDIINMERMQLIRENVKKPKSDIMVDQAVLDKLEAGFKKLEASDSKSLLKKYLTKEVFDNLKTKKTSFGSSLLDVIQSGVENPDSGVGIYAPDAESYTVFADLFDPIIEDYHGGFKKTDNHPPKNWGDVNTFGNLDPAGEYVVSTRVRCGRSMEGYPFNPCLTEEQYKEMEQKVSTTLSGLEGELKGTFYPLTGMSKDVQQKLIDDHFLFKEGDRFLQAANACRFWPTGRGIYHNDNKTFLVWCNEEDHLRLISMQMGGDLGEVYRRLVTAVNDIEKRIPFSHNDRLGFLTFCPTNLGTTVRASVHIKVPKLAANKAKLEEVAAKYNLQVRGTRGEHTEAEGGIYDISNKRRMGLTEFDAVKEMYDGIAEIIKIEKEL